VAPAGEADQWRDSSQNCPGGLDNKLNSIMEQWVQELRHELLHRSLTWNHCHLLRALGEFEDYHNRHRPHQAMDQAAPLRPVPQPIADPGRTVRHEY
jgi:putative transposase